jgi:hypothetical protein
MGKRKDCDLITRKEFCCQSCRNINRIMNIYDKDIVNKNLSLTNYKGRRIRITEYSLPDLTYNKIDKNLYEMDRFSTKLITSLLVNKYQEERDLSISSKVYNSFVCGNNVFVMHEIPLADKYETFLESGENIKSCIFQFMSFLDYMKEYKYSHGESSLTKFRISMQERESRKIHLNKSIKTKITLKILPSSFCSLEMKNGKRIFYNHHMIKKSDLELKDLYHDEKDFFVLQNYLSFKDYQTAKSMGIYNDLSSLDAYNFMVSLFSHPLVRKNIEGDKTLIDMYKFLFDQEETVYFPSEFLDKEKDLYKFLKGKKLKHNLPRQIIENFY